MRGLAWRWIGLHAAAFATASLIQTLALLQVRPKVLGETYGWLFVGTLGVTVALAQAVALKSSKGPMRTFVGIWVGGCAGAIASKGLHEVFFPRMVDIVDLMRLSTWAAVAAAVSEGVILALFQGRGRAWAAAVGGGWAMARAVPALLVWARGYPLAKDRPSWGIEELTQAGCGALFAVVTLPALRKIMAREQGPAPS